MRFTLGLVCSVGVGPARGGRARNEDNYLVCRDGRATWRLDDSERSEPATGEGLLVGVFDGMGGHENGHVAATTAARVLAKLYRPGVPAEPAKAMRRFVLESHQRLYERAAEAGPVSMGTTLTALWLFDGLAAYVHVGDSRLYHSRGGRLEQVTADHTRQEFAWRDGRAVEDGHHLTQNFIYGSRGLGDNTAIRIDEGQDSDLIAIDPGDRLLLCTDGLTGTVDEASIADVLRNVPDPQAAATACVERAMARGSTDNITVMVISVR